MCLNSQRQVKQLLYLFDSSALAKGGSLDNISTKTKRNKDDDDDDVHDYEYIDEDQLDNIRRTSHEQSVSTCVQTKPSNTI